MAGYHIRRGNQQFPVADLDALIRLAREGRIAADDQVGTPEGWVRAESIPGLRPHFQPDPWAAWDSAEEVNAEAVYREALQASPEVGELPVAAFVPLMEVESKLPEVAVEPIGEEKVVELQVEPIADPPPVKAPPESRWVPKDTRPELAVVTGGQNGPDARDRRNPVERPRSERTADGTELIHFPRKVRTLPDLPRPDRSRKPYPIFRVVTWILVGLLVSLLIWVSLQLSNPKPVVNDAALPEKPVVQEVSPILQLEKQIRAALPHDPRPIRQAGDFSDNLTIELQQLRVDTMNVDALVTRWAGRKDDVPQAAEIRITVRKSGELERDMGAIGLSVGRYVHLYRLTVPVFEVTVVDGNQAAKQSFSAEKASQFYEGTIRMEEYLK